MYQTNNQTHPQNHKKKKLNNPQSIIVSMIINEVYTIGLLSLTFITFIGTIVYSIYGIIQERKNVVEKLIKKTQPVLPKFTQEHHPSRVRSATMKQCD